MRIVTGIASEAAERISQVTCDYIAQVEAFTKELHVSTQNGSGRRVDMQPVAASEHHPAMPIDVSGVSSAEIDALLERYARQRVAMAAYGEKSHAALDQLHALRQHGAITADQAVMFVNAITQAADLPGPLQRLHHETMIRFLHAEIEAIFKLMARGDANIQAEAARSLDRYSFGKGGGGGIALVANVSLGAKLGIERGSAGGDIIDVQPKQRFDGFVVGETGSGDEFGEL